MRVRLPIWRREAVGSALACRLLRPPSAPLSVPHASASSLDTRMADGVTGVCCGLRAFHFADRLRAGAGRRSGSGRRPGRVRWGRPLLSRPRGAFGSGAAAEAPAAVDVLSRPRIRSSRGRAGVLVGMDGCEVRLTVIRVPVRARVSRVCPGSPYNVCVFSSKLVSRNTQVPKQTQPRPEYSSNQPIWKEPPSFLKYLLACVFLHLTEASKQSGFACLLAH